MGRKRLGPGSTSAGKVSGKTAGVASSSLEFGDDHVRDRLLGAGGKRTSPQTPISPRTAAGRPATMAVVFFSGRADFGLGSDVSAKRAGVRDH